eukprot:TRINITY_DN8193_c0_g1_i1.p1 TRINITY_DN8193_c0_g1~~TRINITY_DN8193_c0_g1_i1.p1  ORF type:complete len:549 (+),score=145.04 TRINITY_DN8193_c0_g1_i1:52-1647(+)
MEAVAAQYPPPATRISYGTAGFRTRADILPGVMVRVGILSVLRSKELGKAIGVMITASHNPEPDNGVKIVDPDGGMLVPKWEQYAVSLGNAVEVQAVVASIVAENRIDLAAEALIFVGHDNRPHSAALTQRVMDGASALGAKIINLGLVTTPQLHWAVREYNAGKPYTTSDYVKSLTAAFRDCVRGGAKLLPVTIDAANGASAGLLGELVAQLSDVIQLTVRNTSGVINKDCGAAIVQVSKAPPANFSADNTTPNGTCCSYDGDGDRVVFFYFDQEKHMHLLDGDKLIALCAAYVKDLLTIMELDKQLTIGVVQTAYANGASTAYLNSVGVKIACTPTGVKHLHKAAHEFDVGVYFEANGHGTILFSEKARKTFSELRAEGLSRQKQLAVAQLSVLELLANQAVGDAAADMLFALAALTHFQWDIARWNHMYTDLPSKQSVLHVRDPSVVTTADAERKCVTPAGLQEAIDSIVAAAGPSARSFVRPSGTEPVVRVYAEAATQAAMEKLSKDVEAAVSRIVDGGSPGSTPTH